MSELLSKYLTWNAFCNEIIEGCIRDFNYKDRCINISVKFTGLIKKTKKWIFVMHRHDNTGAEIYAEYKTPQLLLENARIDGKSLQEIWDDLELV